MKPGGEIVSLRTVAIVPQITGQAWPLVLGVLFSLLGGFFFDYRMVRFLFLVLSLSLLWPFLFKIQKKILRNYLGMFGLYLLICLASVGWSVNLDKSLGKVLELIIAYFWVCSAASFGRTKLLKIFKVTLYLSCLVLVGTFIAYVMGVGSFVNPTNKSLLGTNAIDNPILGKNGVGILAAIVALSVFVLWQDNKNINYLFFVFFCFFLMFLSYSRTALMAMLLGLSLLHSDTKKRAVVWGALLIGVFAFFGREALLSAFYRGQGASNLLSGRPELWEIAWHEYLKAPFLGYGYGVGSAYATRFVFFDTNVAASTAHNGLLEVLLGVGLLGATVLVPVFLITTYKIFHEIWGDDKMVFASYPVILASSFTNTGVAGWLSIPVFFYLIMLAFLDIKKHENNSCA